MFLAISAPLFIAIEPHNDIVLPVIIGIKFTGCWLITFKMNGYIYTSWSITLKSQTS